MAKKLKATYYSKGDHYERTQQYITKKLISDAFQEIAPT